MGVKNEFFQFMRIKIKPMVNTTLILSRFVLQCTLTPQAVLFSYLLETMGVYNLHKTKYVYIGFIIHLNQGKSRRNQLKISLLGSNYSITTKKMHSI